MTWNSINFFIKVKIHLICCFIFFLIFFVYFCSNNPIPIAISFYFFSVCWIIRNIFSYNIFSSSYGILNCFNTFFWINKFLCNFFYRNFIVLIN